MRRLLIYIASAVLAGAVASGCRAKMAPEVVDETAVMTVVEAGDEAVIPPMRAVKARAYLTAADYRDKVMVTLAEDGSLESWPAVNEVDTASAPIVLVKGYLLDRRDVNPRSAFLDITYVDYSALPATPPASELEPLLIEGSGVIEVIEIPLDRRYALRNPQTCNEIIETRLGDCKILYRK